MSSLIDSVASAIADLDSRQVPQRIWQRDHTVWKPDPSEIVDRLGWLTVAGEMRGRVAELQAFADEVKGDGYRLVVLLGMGGSSLGALALQRLFGSADGYPELLVLDTTIPDTIAEASQAIDCTKTLFIVASKSGTTIEPNMLYRHFRAEVERELGAADAGQHFAAICDSGTALERLAESQGFRHVFTNSADIGGRYSAQSLFGLVPAALMGIDIAALLDRVVAMGAACAPGIPARDNPGAWLGVFIGTNAVAGRDKLTVVSTPSLDGFGLWVEQLLAESTGKDGSGIVPIAGEPSLDVDAIGDDRLFVYARLNGDDTADTDSYIDRVESAGIPAVRLTLEDRHDIGGEFFRWQFATAVAGSLLGIHPFDQPDVQSAKDNTERLLADYHTTGIAPSLDTVGSLVALINEVRDGDYLAITAFAKPTVELESAIDRLRGKISAACGVATTFAYGPRYLHSTGQLHKGGAANGLFLQLTQLDGADVTIPGAAFTFGTLAAAQAQGDLNALAALGRPVARINLPRDAAQTIFDLANCLD
ncbi:MAG: glucose-6-phosphate isomerase [Chloroflexota bacterium]|nr:glucose-6-phosphate isomerase [Chloroflexota bacterium]